MGVMFYPKMSVNVPASAPHPEGTEYRVSIGEEDWEGIYPIVVKVQMVYNGKIAGRKSPSYPIGTNDSERVAQAIADLEERYNKMQTKAEMVIIPAKPATYVPVEQFLAVICSVPEGKLTRWEDIETYLKRIHNAQRIELEANSRWPERVSGKDVPYWRIVGSYGYVMDDSRRLTREQSMERLQKEGHIIEACGRGNMSRRVKDFKTHLYDLSQIPAETVINTDIPQSTFYTAMADICANPNNYRGMTEKMLRHFANDQDGIKEDERLALYAEYAKAELARRGLKP